MLFDHKAFCILTLTANPPNTQLSQLALKIYAMPKLLMIFLISCRAAQAQLFSPVYQEDWVLGGGFCFLF
jgi:hypothetical protein